MTSPGTEPRPSHRDAVPLPQPLPQPQPQPLTMLQRARALWCALLTGLG